MNLTIIL